MTLRSTGTIRALFDPVAADGYPAELMPELTARDVDEAWVALAYELSLLPPDLGPAQRRALLLWVLALYGALEAGSTRLPDAEVAATLRAMGVPQLDAANAEAFAREAPPSIDVAVGSPDGTSPLVHHDGGLFARVAWTREQRVAQWLIDGRDRVLGDVEAIDRAIDDVRARPPRVRGLAMALNTEQLAAVRAASSRRLAVISGGPGTGKTSIVVAILRVLARLGLSADQVALAAPTGKAKHRLQSAVVDALAELDDPAEADMLLRDRAPRAETIHRLLAWAPYAGAFARNRLHPLPYRVVIVDEGSMIDLSMVDHLLEALADDARLVLLGDADQLPSVEVGAVFRDFVAIGGADAVRLRESYRMRVDDPAGGRVYAVAQAINAGDVAAMEARVELQTTVRADPGVHHVEVTRPTELLRALEAWGRTRVIETRDGRTVFDEVAAAFTLVRGTLRNDDAERLSRLLRHAESHRILCVTRSGVRPTGVDAVNTRIRTVVRAERNRRPRFLGEPRTDYWAPGDPVLVERNDYALELWNGDFGVVVWLRDGEAPVRLVVAFQPERGRFVFHPLGALRGDITHAWAMTVHKAQGSELDDAMVVLPWDPIPLMTREIVYTAVSRARRSVVVVGPRAVLRCGVERRLLRRSGLGAAFGLDAPAPAND